MYVVRNRHKVGRQAVKILRISRYYQLVLLLVLLVVVVNLDLD